MLDSITKGYLSLRPAAAANTLARLDGRDTKAIFEAMPRQLAAKVLEHMAPQSAGRCLAQLPAKTGSEILARTPLLAAAAALGLMETDKVKALLAQMPRHAAARLRLRLRYSDRAIGAFVDADVVTLTPDLRVGDALRMLRRSGRRSGYQISVLDEHRHLVGVVDLADLIGSRDRSTIQSLMRPADVVLNARAALHTATNHPAWLMHDSLPVVNRNGVFQGVLERSKVTEEKQQLVTEVAEGNELATTRAALADIFWMGVGAFIVGDTGPTGRNKAED
jgi:magnesium transporter